jgi:hypothetical protein
MNIEAKPIKLKDFTDLFLQHFHSGLKYLKDFYYKKFKKL